MTLEAWRGLEEIWRFGAAPISLELLQKFLQKFMGYYVPRNFYAGGYYHIYNRGNSKQNIFLQEDDYIFYLKKLRKAKKKYSISLICYCLMPNHIHLLLRQDSDIPLSKFISTLHISYPMYFNKKYDRIGHLFQSRFQHKTIDKDEYLLYLSCYIHLNPFIDGLAKKLEDYQWSSYPDYIGLREGTLCDKEPVFLGKSPDWYKNIIKEQAMDKVAIKKFGAAPMKLELLQKSIGATPKNL